MIGLGTWGCNVDTMFFKGNVELTIKDNNGEYDFDLKLPDMDIPDFKIKEIAEDGNTLNAIVNVEMLPGKDISMSVTFEGDSFSGLLKIPFLGKIKLKDGYKIS